MIISSILTIFFTILWVSAAPASKNELVAEALKLTRPILSKIPNANKANRSVIDKEVTEFLETNKLRLGGKDSTFLQERSHHTRTLSNATLTPAQKSVKTISHGVPCGEHGDVLVRQFIPEGGENKTLPVLVYIHGGGWTVGALPDFDGWFRLASSHGGFQVIAMEYGLAPENRYPTQLNEIKTTLKWVHHNAKDLGVDPDRISLGGDSCGGNMASVISQQSVKKPFGVKLSNQFLFYPECKIPFEVPSGIENYNTPYLYTQGVFLFAWNMLPEGKNSADADITPLNGNITKDMPPAFVITNGFDPLRDTGLYYAQKLQANGVPVDWLHNDDLPHGFIQFTPWSKRCLGAALQAIDHIKSKMFK